jgi:hypothetical protein
VLALNLSLDVCATFDKTQIPSGNDKLKGAATNATESHNVTKPNSFTELQQNDGPAA